MNMNKELQELCEFFERLNSNNEENAKQEIETNVVQLKVSKLAIN